MNKINFTAKDNFPLSSDTMALLQDMVGLSANAALLGGSNYILTGCVDDGGGNVGSGIIVIEGELLPFQGGTKKAKVAIQQTSKTLTAFGTSYPEAYVYRTAIFSDTGTYTWADFVQVLTNKQLQQRIESITGDAPGTVKMWAGQVNKIPADYKLCDGTVLSINDYPELFENMGVAFGGNGSDSFALPDLRGRFIVGYDTSNNDYNAINRDKIGGSANVTLTVEEIPAHKHAYTDDTNAEGKYPQIEAGFPLSIGGIGVLKTSGEDSGTGTVYNSQTVGGSQPHENRPPYFVLAYIVKVR